MRAIRLSRSYLKPTTGVAVMLVVFLFSELVSWLASYPINLLKMHYVGGVLPYLWLVLRSLLIPEVMTALIVVWLLNQAHRWFGIEQVESNWRSILGYKLIFLPVLALSFIFFNPVTETVRFLLEGYPRYSLSTFWNVYLAGTFSWPIYIRYLALVLVVGYALLTISLLGDLHRQTSLSPTR